MEEARRFLRFLVPGFVFITLTLLWLLIALPGWTLTQLGHLKESLATIVAVFFASGALGYIFATIHHWCNWNFEGTFLRHTPIIEQLSHEGLIPAAVIEHLNPERAEIVSFSLWYRRIGRDNGVITDAVERRVTALGDRAHGLGATRAASVVALITTLSLLGTVGSLQLEAEPIFRFVVMLVIAGFVIYLVHDSYRRVGRITQGVYDDILRRTLLQQPEANAGVGPRLGQG